MLSSIVPFDRKEVIDENRREIERRRHNDPNSVEVFCVNEDRLNEVFEIINEINNTLSHREKIVKMVAYFMGAMSWAQPFCGANKATAIFMAIVFMRDNGFDLEIPEYDQEALMDLLYRIQEDRSGLDEAVMRSLILYTKKRTIDYEQK